MKRLEIGFSGCGLGVPPRVTGLDENFGQITSPVQANARPNSAIGGRSYGLKNDGATRGDRLGELERALSARLRRHGAIDAKKVQGHRAGVGRDDVLSRRADLDDPGIFGRSRFRQGIEPRDQEEDWAKVKPGHNQNGCAG